VEGDGTPADDGIAGLIGQFVDDAREVADAEIGLIKARVGSGVARFRDAALLFAVAAVLALAALIALLVGLIAALAPHVGAALATVIVCGTSLLIAAILVLIGTGKLRR